MVAAARSAAAVAETARRPTVPTGGTWRSAAPRTAGATVIRTPLGATMWRASLRPASAPRTPRRDPIPPRGTGFRGEVAAVLAASPTRTARRCLGTVLQVSELAAIALFAQVALGVVEEDAGRLVGVPARRQAWACPMLGKGEAKEVGATLRTGRRWSSGFLCGAAGISTGGRASGGTVVVVPPGTPIRVGFALSVAITVTCGHDRLSCRLVS